LELTDTVDMLMAIPKKPDIFEIMGDHPDPGYFFELKQHLELNIEYRKERIEWSKTRTIKSLYLRKDVFFREFIPTFHKDIFYAVRSPKFVSPEVSAKAFCASYRGYALMYGEEFVRRAMVLTIGRETDLSNQC